MSTYVKDPDAVLDYTFDWTAWLPDSDTIITRTITPGSGITVNSSSIALTGKAVVAWLSGGTVGQTYPVTCRITTTEGRTDDRTLYVRIQQR